MTRFYQKLKKWAPWPVILAVFALFVVGQLFLAPRYVWANRLLMSMPLISSLFILFAFLVIALLLLKRRTTTDKVIRTFIALIVVFVSLCIVGYFIKMLYTVLYDSPGRQDSFVSFIGFGLLLLIYGFDQMASKITGKKPLPKGFYIYTGSLLVLLTILGFLEISFNLINAYPFTRPLYFGFLVLCLVLFAIKKRQFDNQMSIFKPFGRNILRAFILFVVSTYGMIFLSYKGEFIRISPTIVLFGPGLTVFLFVMAIILILIAVRSLFKLGGVYSNHGSSLVKN